MPPPNASFLRRCTLEFRRTYAGPVIGALGIPPILVIEGARPRLLWSGLDVISRGLCSHFSIFCLYTDARSLFPARFSFLGKSACSIVTMTDVHHPLAPVPRGTRRERNGDDACQQSKRTNISVACTACKARKLKVPYTINIYPCKEFSGTKGKN